MNLLPVLRLVRAGALLSPAADVAAGLCLTGAPWSLEALRAALASVCLYAAGMALNDFADREEDRRQRPERPIPRGDLSVPLAGLLGFGLLALGLALAPEATRPLHIAIAVLVLGYDFVLKRWALGAVLAMGLLRGSNLLTGTLLLRGDFLPIDDPLGRVVAIAAGAYALYIGTVTLLGRLEDEKNPSPRMVTSLLAVAPVTGLIALSTTQSGSLAAGVGLIPVLMLGRWMNRQGREWPAPRIRQGVMNLLLGSMLYTSLLCLGSDRWIESLAIFGAVFLARRISRWIAWT